MEARGPTFLMTCVCVLLAQWIAAFLMPSGLVFLALRPASLWDYALIWSGLVSAPLHALVVKFLLPGLARGHVSYPAALVGCLCGALVASAVFMVEVSSAPSTSGLLGRYFPALFGTVGILSAIASVAVAAMVVWASANDAAPRRGFS